MCDAGLEGAPRAVAVAVAAAHAAEAQPHLGPTLGDPHELGAVGHRAHQGEANLQPVVLGRGLPYAAAVVADPHLEPARREREVDRERPGLVAVGVLDHVVAGLADGGVHVAQQLGVEPEHLAGRGRHAPNEPCGLRSTGQLKADPR